MQFFWHKNGQWWVVAQYNPSGNILAKYFVFIHGNVNVNEIGFFYNAMML